MKNYKYEVVIIGGGPAGLGAALAAKEKGASVAIIERNTELGGILNQCIHSGFGLQYFKEELTGPEYAERFIDKVREAEIPCFLETMVLEITPDLKISAINQDGVVVFEASSVILAMGCRERTRGAIKIPGDRAAGVFTAGLAQRYVNMENLKPGNKIAILGSGDIGLVMARRLTLEGMEVVGVYELMPYPNGLYRNIKNCLDDFDIPLHLATTVTKINGRERLESIEVAKVDGFTPIEGTEETVECDTLLLSIGLIPENELSVKAGVDLSPITNGPVVDCNLATNIPGVFACGNVLHVHDLVDNVTHEAEVAGSAAAAYAKKQVKAASEHMLTAVPDGLVRYTVPSQIDTEECPDFILKFRVGRPIDSGMMTISCGDKVVVETKKPRAFIPSVMEEIKIKGKTLAGLEGKLVVSVKEA